MTFKYCKWNIIIVLLLILLPTGRSQVPDGWEGKVMTVRGLIPADSLGITLPHEHLLIVHKYNYLDLTNETDAINELNYFVNAGGKSLAEASAIGIGRNPEGLKRISEATGANVIMSAGYYKDQWIHDTLKSKSIDQLKDIIISDIRNGINGIRAGFIKIAMSNPITPFEERVLIAAARAQLATGSALDVHFDGHRASIADRHHVLDVFENEGVDLSRVYLSHCVQYLDLVDDFITLAKRGCYLSFDLIGSEKHILFENELKLYETLNALINAGYLNQLLMSQDVCFSVLYLKNGGYGYGHILNNIVPQLKAKGITDEQIHTIMVENPARLFPFKSYTSSDHCSNSVYTAITGTISDNSGLSDYANNMNCSKLLQPLNSNTVVLSFTEFNTESANDVLTVYDGPTTSFPVLGQFSGSSLPPVVESSGNSMLVVFNTNGSTTKSGWKADYYGRIDEDYSGPCVNEIFAASSGTITDNSGTSDYTGYMTCQKLIEVPGSSGITLQFTSFATESGFDIVKVYDGNTTSAPLLGQFSGNAIPPVLNSTGGSMLVMFTTDYDQQAAGWSANYYSNMLSVVPNSRIVDPAAGTITFSVSSNVVWSVSESSTWLTATKTDANTITISYDNNPDFNSRTADITISGTGVVSQVVTVNQSGIVSTLSVSPKTRTVESSQGVTTFKVTSNINWSVSESAGWLSVTKTNDTTLTVNYDSNTTVNSRSTQITVSGSGVIPENLTVTQDGAVPALSILPTVKSVDSPTGTATFNVTSNVVWSVSESSGWLSAAKTDVSTITVSYDENTSFDARSAEITVSGPGVTSQKIILNQSGVKVMLNITPDTGKAEPLAGQLTFSVNSNFDWTFNESSEWLTAVKSNTTNLTVNYDENLVIDERLAEITINSGDTSVTIYVNQVGAEPIVDVTPEYMALTSAAGIVSFKVVSNANWSVSESTDWFLAAKTNDTTFLVSYNKNTSFEIRSDLITVSAGTKVVDIALVQQGAVTDVNVHSENDNQIKVIPNPVYDRAWLIFPKNSAEIIEIFDASGRLILILNDLNEKEKVEIDFSGLNPGLYMVRFINKQGNIINGKILKR